MDVVRRAARVWGGAALTQPASRRMLNKLDDHGRVVESALQSLKTDMMAVCDASEKPSTHEDFVQKHFIMILAKLQEAEK